MAHNTDLPNHLRGRGRGRDLKLRGNAANISKNRNPVPQLTSSAQQERKVGGNNSNIVWQNNNGVCDNNTLIAAERFEATVAMHRASVLRHLESSKADNLTVNTSPDEEDGCAESVLAVVARQFGDDISLLQLGRTADFLRSAFSSDATTCLICIEGVGRQEAVWSCSVCYALFHLPCILKWVKEGAYQSMLHSSFSEEQFPTRKAGPWSCPNCRTEFDQCARPTRYFCFCGRLEDPPVDPWLVPHSCGEPCGRPLSNGNNSCGHSCTLLCHPGPCPPCPQTVSALCYCGAGSTRILRCSLAKWSCGSICGRQLSCEYHFCQDVCHLGECSPCNLVSKRKCRCGRKNEERSCVEREWSCGSICGRVLECGQHRCAVECHSGSCGPCPRADGLRTCPCGKTPVQGLACTEEASCCAETCGRLLQCNTHTCPLPCHTGACQPCRQSANKRCRCGQRVKQLPCSSKEFTCDARCPRSRDCQRHPCRRKCCAGDCPPCEQQCGRQLNCLNHRCESRCHNGPCYPCPVVITLQCACSTQSMRVPCGREKRVRPPRCQLLCRQPADCKHPTRHDHACHPGDCPPCELPCGRIHPACGHECPQRCHDAVPTLMRETVLPAAGPWAVGRRGPERIELLARACQACQHPVEVTCPGGHEIVSVPCSEAEAYKNRACGRECGFLLSCTHHKCSLPCHSLEKMSCQECELECQQKRPALCPHPCQLRVCHPGACPICPLFIRRRCHCGAMLLHIECNKWAAESADHDALQACSGLCPKMRSDCGHPCGRPCHSGTCPTNVPCQTKVQLRCACRRLRRRVLCVQGAELLLCDEECVAQLRQEEERHNADLQQRQAKEAAAALHEVELLARRRNRRRRRDMDPTSSATSENQQGEAKQLSFCRRLLALLVSRNMARFAASLLVLTVLVFVAVWCASGPD